MTDPATQAPAQRPDPRERAVRFAVMEATGFVNKFVLLPSLAAGSLLWFTRDWAATAFIGLLLIGDLIPYLPVLARANPGVPALNDHVRSFVRALLLIGAVGDRLYGPAAQAPAFLTLVGIAVVGTGIALQVIAAREFVRAENPMFTTQQTHTLVTSGIFRWIRHPAYAGMFLISVGAALLLRSLLGAGSIAVVIGAFLVVRVLGEEKKLLATYGDEYRAYMKRVKRFVPFLF